MEVGRGEPKAQLGVTQTRVCIPPLPPPGWVAQEEMKMSAYLTQCSFCRVWNEPSQEISADRKAVGMTPASAVPSLHALPPSVPQFPPATLFSPHHSPRTRQMGRVEVGQEAPEGVKAENRVPPHAAPPFLRTGPLASSHLWGH